MSEGLAALHMQVISQVGSMSSVSLHSDNNEFPLNEFKMAEMTERSVMTHQNQQASGRMEERADMDFLTL